MSTRFTRPLVTAVTAVVLLSALLPSVAAARLATIADTPETLQMGTVTVSAPPEAAPVKNVPGVWAIVPGLSTSVYSRAGDSLDITFTAEVYSTATVMVRALVDLAPAQPAEVKFKYGGENFDGVRSFTFVVPNVGTGTHTVEMLWFTDFGKSAQIRDRTLSVNSASATAGSSRLVVGFGDPAIHETILGASVKSYQDIPGLNKFFETTAAGQLAVTFSADAHADSGRLFARAIVDGTVLSDVLFDEAGNGDRRGTRSHTFVLPSLPAGRHTVRIQWKGEGGQVRLGGRTMSAYVSPTAAASSSMLATGRQLAPTRIRSSIFGNIPTMSGSFTTTAASTSATLLWSGEVQINSGRLFLRALVDGKPVSPSDVTLIQGGPKFRAASYDFIATNLLPGTHTVQFQASVDKGKVANIGDRSMKVIFKHRTGAEFSQPYLGLQPTTGVFNPLVICFDPLRDGQFEPTLTSMQNMFEGLDGGLSVPGWYNENTAGRIAFGQYTYNGCQDDGRWHLAPEAHRGNWYWDNGRFDLMWAEAIQAADPTFDFHAFDANHDNNLTPDELLVVIVRPQNEPYGTNRSVSVKVDGNDTPLNIHVVDIYLSSVSTNRRWNVGLLSHEFAHATFNAWDMYGAKVNGVDCAPVTAPQFYSIMDAHWLATDIDPFHKLKNGFVAAQTVEFNSIRKPVATKANGVIGLGTRTLTLGPVETTHDVAVLYDPVSHPKEYFIVENRWPGTQANPTYDSQLGAGGVVVWLVVQSESLATQFPPPGGAGCSPSRVQVRKLAILNTGGLQALEWADGSRPRVQVEANLADPTNAVVTVSTF